MALGNVLAELVVKIGVDTGDLNKGLGDAEKKLSSFGGMAKTAGIAVAGLGIAAVGAGIASATAFATMADNLDEMSVRTGISTTALQEFQYAAKLTGSSLEGVEGAIKKMQVNISLGSKAVETLGIDLASLQRLKPEEQFSKIADMIAEIQDPAERAAMAVKIFGKSGTDLLPMMIEGSAGLKAMAAEANSLGIIMGEDAVKQGASFKDAIDKLEMSLGGVVNQIGAALIPILEPLIPLFADLIKSLPLKEFGELLRNLLPPLIEMFMKLMKAIPMDVMLRFVMAVLTPLLNILNALMPALLPIIDLFGTLLKILTPVLNVLGWILEKIVSVLASGIGSFFSQMGSGASLISGLISGYASGGIVPGGIGQPQLAMVHGGETIIPAGGGGGMNVVVNVAGSVIAERDLAQTLRRELLMIQDRNYSTGIA